MSRRRAWALVAAQVVLLVLLGWPARRRHPASGPRRMIATLGVLSGAGLAAWGSATLGPDLRPSPLPRADSQLHTDGPYRWVRHPIYTGLLLMIGARALTSTSPRHRLAAAGLVALLRTKAVAEERLLAARHPEYEGYARRVPRLLPRPRRTAKRRPTRTSPK